MTAFSPSSPDKLRVDIWSDIACPWCYIGKRRFEQALQHFPHANQVEIHWHSFELDPSGPELRQQSTAEMLAQKYGRTPSQAQDMLNHVTQTAAAEGLQYDFQNLKLANTFRAHQLIHLAAQHGLGPLMKERLLHAYFTEGQHLGDPVTLLKLAQEVGLNAQEVQQALETGAFAQAVRQDERQAQALGIQGVPFFVLGGKYGLSGAQNAEVFTQALHQVWNETHPATLTMLSNTNPVHPGNHANANHEDNADEGCEDGSCAVPTPPTSPAKG